MRIKSKPQDFRVFELLRDDYVGDKGRFRVYRVTKKKLTSLEAARELALATGVESSAIGMAGMKDRQGVTTQFMTVRGGRPVRFRTPNLRVETAGFAQHELSSQDSVGNGFEIVLRGVGPAERDEIEREAAVVREHGLPNYFGEQRFGNLRHGQGWVAKELALGRTEAALKNLLAAPSENDNPRMRAFKRALDGAWGDWKRCRDVAGVFGAHHSVFEHLAGDAEDFAGAFRYVKNEVRLIHLYAWQSHLWNRAVARWISDVVPRDGRFLVPSIEGPFVFARGALPVPPEWNGNFRMPGEGLDDVADARQRQWLTAALTAEGLEPADLRIRGVPGFALKGEDRALVVRPRGIAIDEDRRSPGVLHVRFDLPRGSYATLVLARLAPSREMQAPETRTRAEDEPRGRGGAGRASPPPPRARPDDGPTGPDAARPPRQRGRQDHDRRTRR
jgi:tRNA pseudouridine13 synthase